MALRQSSIGIRRVQPSGALRQFAAEPNVPVSQPQGPGSRLPVLDETCALEHPQTNTSVAGSSASSTTQQDESRPGRLRRASLAVKAKLGLKTDAEKDAEAGAVPSRPTTPTADSGLFAGNRDYHSQMVDVLDTLGRARL